MKTLAPITAIPVALFALAACGSGSNETSTSDAPNGVVEEAGSDSYAVGDSFEVVGLDGESSVTVTFDAFHWMDPEYVDGHESYGVGLFSVDNTDGDSPVQLVEPLDGGGWQYVDPDGEMSSLYGLSHPWTSNYGPVTTELSPHYPHEPGVKSSDLTLDVIASERGGQIAYKGHDGELGATVDIPGESVNDDQPVYDEIYRVADEEWDGEAAWKDDSVEPCDTVQECGQNVSDDIQDAVDEGSASLEEGQDNSGGAWGEGDNSGAGQDESHAVDEEAGYTCDTLQEELDQLWEDTSSAEPGSVDHDEFSAELNDIVDRQEEAGCLY